jgi:lysophospholipase L1-like esterase
MAFWTSKTNATEDGSGNLTKTSAAGTWASANFIPQIRDVGNYIDWIVPTGFGTSFGAFTLNYNAGSTTLVLNSDGTYVQNGSNVMTGIAFADGDRFRFEIVAGGTGGLVALKKFVSGSFTTLHTQASTLPNFNSDGYLYTYASYDSPISTVFSVPTFSSSNVGGGGGGMLTGININEAGSALTGWLAWDSGNLNHPIGSGFTAPTPTTAMLATVYDPAPAVVYTTDVGGTNAGGERAFHKQDGYTAGEQVMFTLDVLWQYAAIQFSITDPVSSNTKTIDVPAHTVVKENLLCTADGTGLVTVNFTKLSGFWAISGARFNTGTFTAPANVTVSGLTAVGGDQVNGTITGEPAAVSYIIESATDSGFTTATKTITSLTASFQFKDLLGGESTTHYFRAKAISVEGVESASWSATVSISTGVYIYNLVLEGDSRTAEATVPAIDRFATKLKTLLGGHWKVSNIAAGGAGIGGILTNDEVHTQLEPLYDAGFARNVTVLWIGYNDFNGGRTDTDVRTDIETWTAAAIAEGWSVFVCTDIPNSSGWTPTQEGYRTSLNTGLRFNHAFANGGLIDLDGDTRFASPGTNTAFADGVHLTGEGSSYIAEDVLDVLAPVVHGALAWTVDIGVYPMPSIAGIPSTTIPANPTGAPLGDNSILVGRLTIATDTMEVLSFLFTEYRAPSLSSGLVDFEIARRSGGIITLFNGMTITE